jgi:leader peptidase (prepilin peptidase) / N-methyltransferase
MPEQDTFIYIQNTHPWFFQVVVFVFGACMGSFFNVCIYRIPAKKSIVSPGSQNARGDLIAWYDNIPILSWFILGGRDRKTGERFSFRYPVVEFLTAILFLLLWNLLPAEQAIVGVVFFSLLIVSAFIDVDHMILPDVLTVGGTITGVFLSALIPALHGHVSELDFIIRSLQSIASSMLGILIGSAIILWFIILGESFLKREVMGYGDIVFMGCIGAFCGWQGALFSIFGGAIIGSLVGIPLLLIQRKSKYRIMATASLSKAGTQELDKNDKKADDVLELNKGLRGSSIPFGPWLAVAAVIYYLFMRDEVALYFDRLSFLIN